MLADLGLQHQAQAVLRAVHHGRVFEQVGAVEGAGDAGVDRALGGEGDAEPAVGDAPVRDLDPGAPERLFERRLDRLGAGVGIEAGGDLHVVAVNPIVAVRRQSKLAGTFT